MNNHAKYIKHHINLWHDIIGQTQIQLHIGAAYFSEKGKKVAVSQNPMLQTTAFDSIMTFAAIDFYEFETELSGLGLSWSPKYNHTIR